MVESPAEVTEVEAGLEFFGSYLVGPSAQWPSGPSPPNLTAQGQVELPEHFQTSLEVPTGCLSGRCEGSLCVLIGILS